MTSTRAAEGDAPAPAWPGAADRRPARSWAGRIVLVVAVGALAGWLGVVTQPDEHVARAVLVLTMEDDEDSAARAAATQRALLSGKAVLGPVAERTGTPVDDLVRAVEVEAEPGTAALRVDVTARSPGRATVLLTEIVEEYLTVGNSAGGLADELVRVRLVLPPHLVDDGSPTAGGGAAAGAATGLGVAVAAAATDRARRRAGR